MNDQRPYRGISKETGKWVYGELVTLHYPYSLNIAQKGNNQDWHNTFFIEVIPETVGQSTGIPDKDIWQDDTMVSQDQLRKYVVKHDYKMGWYLSGIERAWAVHQPNWEEYICTGSIHDHLLKGAEND